MNKHFDYGYDVLVILDKDANHLYPFNNKIGRVISRDLTKKYNLNNHPENNQYVLLFKPSAFNEEERQYLISNNCPIYDDEDGVPCFLSDWIFKDNEVFAPNKKLMLRNDLIKLAKIN